MNESIMAAKIVLFTTVKNRRFHVLAHIFVSPGDAPGAITLNVEWTERKFDAYKLSRCMCHLTIIVSEIGRKSSFFSYPLAFDAPVRGVPVGLAPPRLVWKN